MLARATKAAPKAVSKQKTEIQRSRDRQLAEWLRLGLAKSGLEKQALAQALGLHPSAISHMIRGAREFKEAELQIIAKMIKEAPPPLMQDNVPAETRVEHVRLIGWAHPTVMIATNVWREAGATVTLSERVPLSPDPRLDGVEQYVCKIEGSARYAVCVDFSAFRTAPRIGDMVHVVRTSGVLEEHTLHRVVSISNGRPYIVPLDRGGTDLPLDKSQEMRGLVVGFYAPEPVDI